VPEINSRFKGVRFVFPVLILIISHAVYITQHPSTSRLSQQIPITMLSYSFISFWLVASSIANQHLVHYKYLPSLQFPISTVQAGSHIDFQ
jgi:hypothetical protein